MGKGKGNKVTPIIRRIRNLRAGTINLGRRG
jgi:hypothetical protein